MSNHKIPPFDMLYHQHEPYSGFGKPLMHSTQRENLLYSLALDAKKRLEEGFGRQLCDPDLLEKQLDEIIDEIWKQGWDPEASDLNLFVTDFGLVLTYALLLKIAGTLIFRSEDDISHLSIWMVSKEIEIFPFHKVLKRFYQQEGESIETFVKGLVDIINKKNE